jgi:MoaA/NifB/PqqE/SkfB family radical SAM enzyme
MADFGYIQIIRVCNQKCLFCSNPSNGHVLSTEEIKKIILRYKKNKLAGIYLTGGEPTMHPDLFEIIRYCKKNNVECKIITNGQRLAYPQYMKALYASGLRQLHVSIYSNRKNVQDKLTQNDGAIVNLQKAFRNLAEYPEMSVSVNITINRQNQDHLKQVVRWVINNYPHKLHFVFNNLDPRPSVIKKYPEVVPQLLNLKKGLSEALRFLSSSHITFRVERVPLCFMPEFAYSSTETRKIVKIEKRSVFFLDEKGIRTQKDFYRLKGKSCKKCSLDRICAGVDGNGEYYKISDLNPISLGEESIIKIIDEIKKEA